VIGITLYAQCYKKHFLMINFTTDILVFIIICSTIEITLLFASTTY